MREFSAKQLHENPSKVYQAANREPVVITHRHHGRLILRAETMHEEIESELLEKLSRQHTKIKVSDMDLHISHTTAKETGVPE